jgi:protocatechuate 3,4-dioxygenase beta subunit
MENDDHQIGYMLTRREAIGVMGAAGVMLFTGCRPSSRSMNDTTVVGSSAEISPGVDMGAGTCVVRPQLTEGPYFVDERLNRSDIRSDPSDGTIKPGTPLQVSFNVSRFATNACTPLAGMIVDLWQCDHAGVYSDVRDRGFTTTGQKFLRGYQTTDANGVATFTTIYPGWYRGRAVHLHFKIRSTLTGSGHEFTSQLFFDDSLTDAVHAKAPYAEKGPRDVRNSRDGIFNRGGGQLLVPLAESGEGYAGSFGIALQGV